jgi:hypothetical protein
MLADSNAKIDAIWYEVDSVVDIILVKSWNQSLAVLSFVLTSRLGEGWWLGVVVEDGENVLDANSIRLR